MWEIYGGGLRLFDVIQLAICYHNVVKAGPTFIPNKQAQHLYLSSESCVRGDAIDD